MLDLGRTFLGVVERSPQRLALVDGEVRFTYAQWLERIAAATGRLQRIGLQHGDHLLVVMRNRWQMATLHWACQFLGVIATPLNWRAKSEEIEFCAVDAQARAVAFDDSAADAVNASPACCAVPRIAIGADPRATVSFNELVESSPPQIATAAGAEDCSVMVYTSGTTGRPKGVPRKHRAERAAAVAHVAQNLYRTGERTLGVMPLYHTMGVRSLLAMALVDGCFVCLAKFDAARALELVARERITNLYLVPTLYHDLIEHPHFARADVSSVRKLGFAGAPMSAALLKRVDAAFHPELLVNHYGSSEIYTFTIEPNAARKPGSAGRAGLSTRIRVVRLGACDPGQVAAVREEGQIIADLKSDEAFERYWNRPDADARSLQSGWYFTGDTGFIDEEGDLFVTGRVDDMIISGGENISPVEIESMLSLHAAVEEVAVVGLPDERWGQRVTAFVKRRTLVASEALDAHCRSSGLPNFKRPREYVFVREIPKSPVGKILRRKLVAGEYDLEG